MVKLFNFCDEDLVGRFDGCNFILLAGEMSEQPEDRATAFMRRFERRGLVRLGYGDSIDDLEKNAREILRAFKESQVRNFISINKVRVTEGKGPLAIPDHIRRYANDLNIEIEDPYLIKRKDSGDSYKIEQLQRDNRELRDMVNALMQKLNEKNDPEDKKKK